MLALLKNVPASETGCVLVGRFSLCFHWWQQILQYHNCINNLIDDECLIKCAFVEDVYDPAYLLGSHKFYIWLQGQSVGLSIEDDLDVSTVIGDAKNRCAQTWHQSSLSSVVRDVLLLYAYCHCYYRRTATATIC